MIIAISGTPGTGKTTVAKELARLVHAKQVSIRSLVDKGAVPYTWDAKRKTRIVSMGSVKKSVKENTQANQTTIVEGHVAHLIPEARVIVLRTNPVELRKRLLKKRWKESKIRENVEAEILDIITAEALEKQKRVYEIDTSRKTPLHVAKVIVKILNNLPEEKKYRASRISWLPQYQKILLR